MPFTIALVGAVLAVAFGERGHAPVDRTSASAARASSSHVLVASDLGASPPADQTNLAGWRTASRYRVIGLDSRLRGTPDAVRAQPVRRRQAHAGRLRPRPRRLRSRGRGGGRGAARRRSASPRSGPTRWPRRATAATGPHRSIRRAEAAAAARRSARRSRWCARSTSTCTRRRPSTSTTRSASSARRARRTSAPTLPHHDVDEMAAVFRAADVLGVLFAWDAETNTGLPPVTNDFVAGCVRCASRRVRRLRVGRSAARATRRSSSSSARCASSGCAA